MHVDRNTAPVVFDADRVVGVYHDVDMIAVSSECFVDRVVYDFVNEVVQTAWPGGSDVHTGTLPDSFEALENLYLTGIVFFGFSHALLAFGLGWRSDP